MNSSDLAEQLCEKFPDLLGDPVEFRGEITLQLVDAQRIEEVCRYAKQSLGFDFLLDIGSVDNYGEDPRWTMVYELSGIDNGSLLRLFARTGYRLRAFFPPFLGVRVNQSSETIS